MKKQSTNQSFANDNARDDESILTGQNFRKELAKISDRWKDHYSKDLAIRHETGAFLNRHLGPPTERLCYGGKVLATVAEQCGTDKTELSRMRWFAHYFKRVEDLESKHPDVTSWTRVRKLLPTLSNDRKSHSASDPSDKEKQVAVPRRSPLVGLRRSLTACSNRFDNLNCEMTDKELNELEKIFKTLSEAVSASLGWSLSINKNVLAKS
jgi:hypothetical protein